MMLIFLERIKNHIQYIYNSVKLKTVEDFIEFLQNNYLYSDQITDIDNWKRNLHLRNRNYYYDVNQKMKNSGVIDEYTKINSTLKVKAKILHDVILPHTFYIKFNCITNDISKSFIDLVSHCDKDYLVIDLRDNCGGDIEAAIQMANCLLHECEICNLRYKNKKVIYYSDSKQINFHKIFVLINENTISSAEMLYLSLYFNLNEVYLIGSPSYKKGTGQLKYFSKYDKKHSFSVTSFDWLVHDVSIVDFHMNNELNHCLCVIDTNNYNEYISNIIELIEVIV